jgi:DNA-directed RNA polymerase delta subunit
LQERSDLDIAIAALQKRLGMPVGIPAQTQKAALNASTTPAGDIITYHGEFHGLSLTKATEQVLRRANRPLKTPQIVKALQSANFEMRAKSPRTNLYTTLKRSPMFVKVLPDTWDLAEKHPQLAALKKEQSAEKKAKKKKSSDKKPQTIPQKAERAVA